jgi:hypothetical protein
MSDRKRKSAVWIVAAIAAGALANSASAGAQTLDVSNARVVEGDSVAQTALFTVTLSPPSSSAVFVHIGTHERTATDPEDYFGVPRRLRFTAGATHRRFAVAVQADIADEPLERFVAKLTHPQGAVLGDGVGVARIVDNDDVLNETDLASEADECDLTFPPTFTMAAGDTSPQIFGQIFEAGETEAAGPSSQVEAQLGYGPDGSNPTTQPQGWVFYPATWDNQISNNDEYAQTLTVLTDGIYSYTYRFSLDDGFGWTYCDLDGAGSDAGLSFDPSQLGQMTVTP